MVMSKKVLPLSNNIRFLRKLNGFNQEELANKLNIKRSNIAAYETKNVEPRLRIILELAKLFNIDVSTFLSTTLDAETKYEEFIKEDIELFTDTEFINVDKSHIDNFIDKSIQIKKILTGFKSFYAFKKSKITNITPSTEKIIFDIDNFIQLMEHLISHNESMIRILSSQKK